MVFQKLTETIVLPVRTHVSRGNDPFLDPEGLEISPSLGRVQDVDPSAPGVVTFEVGRVAFGVGVPGEDLGGLDAGAEAVEVGG